MKNLRQIGIVLQMFAKKRQGYLAELSHLAGVIAKKQESINKMKAYYEDYTNNENLRAMQRLSSLHANYVLFIYKIANLIIQAESELEQILKSREYSFQKLAKIDNQIQAMNRFKDRALNVISRQEESREQALLDDLQRGSHE